ncbi:DUF1566 domain-containing protein [Billgrantia desiderata]|uniref:DUF1566 domain-containing protein n=1 Tax=Billgrantia desiderata TaxID=52021 RepID=UPI001F1FDD07|nr:DUF1566 domain-containing protein [Halomonas desiderata]MCE8012904.1 hypothetical protein [Halomonas desiderata]
MAVHIAWTDTNDQEDGYRVYIRDTPMSWPSDVPTPVTLGADATGYTADVDETQDWYVIVTAFKGAAEVAAEQVIYDGDSGSVDPGGPGDDFSTAQIGDEIGGGIYAGVCTYGDGRQFHIVFAKQEGELAPSAESRWKTSPTSTPGTTSADDGWANTLAMEAAGLADHPAALHCRNYTGGGKTDWYLPARTELALEANVRAHPELSLDRSVYRWTSTENSSDGAWYRRFSDGHESSFGNKDFTTRRVRPVRRVAV